MTKIIRGFPLFTVGDLQFDSLDLKVAILSRGINVDEEIYSAFERNYRLSRHPRSCNTMLLNGEVSVSLARTDLATPFRLVVSDGRPVITHNGRFVTEIEFPRQTLFYEQKTSNGIPFGDLAVIQGWDMLAFACLWLCDIAQSGRPCGFCHTGQLSAPEHTVSDMIEIIRYAVENDPQTKILQMTAGSTFSPETEIDRYVEILKAIDRETGLSKVPTIIYLTPPSDMRRLDRLFDAGVDQIACDMDIWDEALFTKICPGKAQFTTRQRYLDALLYIAERFGRNRACCVFVAGLEPVESLIEGETFLAEHGIVPLPSPLMPFGISGKLLNETSAADIDYFRIVKRETAKLYNKHQLIVPGTYGSDVCLSRDIWLRREMLAN
ncbi:MAG: radical SAM protein [Prevotellaceae bacterium]|jgi:hypothetical protein|nr:radical SAM protein [Prevotellaceae bacterium]